MNTKITKEGWMIIEQDTHVGKWIEESGKLDHDEFMIPLAVSNIPIGGVAMDLGALYGDHSVGYARKLGETGTLIAVEAGEMAYRCLLHNAKKFECPTICIHAAVCDNHGGKAMHSVHEENLGASRINEEEPKAVEIRTVSIDGIVKDADLSRLDFIKIDCEGFEYKILQGAVGTLKHFKPILMMEINLGALVQQGDTDKKIYDFLLGMNYSWRILQSDCTGSSPQFDILAWANLIQLPLVKLI